MAGETNSAKALIAIVDDDAGIRESLDAILRSAGYSVVAFASPREWLDRSSFEDFGCIVIDVRLPRRSGLDLQDDIAKLNVATPIVMITGYADIPMTVRAMKAGAIQFLTKPVGAADLLAAIEEAVAKGESAKAAARQLAGINLTFQSLNAREKAVFEKVSAGLINKQIAAELGLSEATVKLHRGSVMRKLQAQSVADLVRIADKLDGLRT